ncbi:hypothetical protein EO081_07600 [Sphingomonas desiccabilis]|uniref:Uncharacterized protein n=1 Tax=Sphingomonas desiccabilis TaxID=429134 RepID=A0A4Q2J174_9SPHN|nr:hypothetical protein [Sphingomonas desiccabilis]MBB3910872.1 hypothetical protein [Sphingomonas desiccabilis]RXZ35473.1 hypothetical protein EO081_07600 [Sphingomonas desiccabilis]
MHLHKEAIQAIDAFPRIPLGRLLPQVRKQPADGSRQFFMRAGAEPMKRRRDSDHSVDGKPQLRALERFIVRHESSPCLALRDRLQPGRRIRNPGIGSMDRLHDGAPN